MHVSVAFQVVYLFILNTDKGPDPPSIQLQNSNQSTVADTGEPSIVVHINEHGYRKSAPKNEIYNDCIVIEWLAEG